MVQWQLDLFLSSSFRLLSRRLHHFWRNMFNNLKTSPVDTEPPFFGITTTWMTENVHRQDNNSLPNKFYSFFLKTHLLSKFSAGFNVHMCYNNDENHKRRKWLNINAILLNYKNAHASYITFRMFKLIIAMQRTEINIFSIKNTVFSTYILITCNSLVLKY